MSTTSLPSRFLARLGIFLIASFALVPFTLAASLPDIDSMVSGALSPVLLGVLSFISQIAVFLTLMLTGYTGDLMTSEYIFGNGMTEMLQLTWTVFRNFVNVGFILILIITAALVVIGIGGDSAFARIKKILVQLVIALIGINLTFFGARVILTVNDVLATAIFTVPSSISLVSPNLRAMCDPKVTTYQHCQQIIEKQLGDTLSKEASDSKTQAIRNTIDKLREQMQNPEGISAELIQNSFSTPTALFALVNYMYSLTNVLQPIAPGAGGDTSGTIDLLMSVIFMLLITGAIFLVVAAMFVAFLARVVFIWIAIAVSPLVFLLLAVKELIPGASGISGGPLDSMLDDFVKAAFLPTMVAFPLSVGFVFLMAGLSLDFQPSAVTIRSMLDGTDSLSRLMWFVAALGIIWKGSFDILEKAPLFGASVVQKLKGVGDGAVDMMSRGVQSIPIIPNYGPLGSLSFSQAKDMATTVPNRLLQAREIALQEKVTKYFDQSAGKADVGYEVGNIAIADPKKGAGVIADIERLGGSMTSKVGSGLQKHYQTNPALFQQGGIFHGITESDIPDMTTEQLLGHIERNAPHLTDRDAVITALSKARGTLSSKNIQKPAVGSAKGDLTGKGYTQLTEDDAQKIRDQHGIATNHEIHKHSEGHIVVVGADGKVVGDTQAVTSARTQKAQAVTTATAAAEARRVATELTGLSAEAQKAYVQSFQANIKDDAAKQTFTTALPAALAPEHGAALTGLSGYITPDGKDDAGAQQWTTPTGVAHGIHVVKDASGTEYYAHGSSQHGFVKAISIPEHQDLDGDINRKLSKLATVTDDEALAKEIDALVKKWSPYATQQQKDAVKAKMSALAPYRAEHTAVMQAVS